MSQRQQVNKRGKITWGRKKKITGLGDSEGGEVSSATPHTCAMKGKAVVEPVHLCVDGEEQSKGRCFCPAGQ